jgi:collagen type III alpha
MSTTLDRRKAKKNYAEFDEYISYQLQKTQTGIRSTDIFTAVCGAAVFVISYLLVFVVLDHWVVTGGFGNGMRAVLLVGLLVGTLAWIGWKVVWPCFRRVNSLYAAKALEEASPELKSTLLNYVDLRSAQREVAPAIIDSMEKRAAVTLSHAEVDDAIDRSTLLRLSYALLAAVVLFSAYSIVSPKKVWPSIVRIFAPSSDVSVSTQTAFLSVDPGDTKVLAREFLTVTADLAGEVPEDVTLFFTTADQQFVDEPVPMREVEAGLKRYQCILKGDRGEGLLQGLTYRIAAGDASTQTYHVTVAQPPSAIVQEVRYSFPDYMELPPERAVGSNIDTWEGTKIEISATANMVVESAKMQFSDEAEFPARCEEIRMKVGGDGTSLSGLWQPIIRDDGTYPKFYRVQCRTKDGATDPTPVVHSIQIEADQKPHVSILQPGGDLEVAANAVVPLLIHASDPDFRLSRVVLRMKNGARVLTDRSIYKGDDVEQRVLHELNIAELNAKPGDVITWWVEAHDNRRVETSTRTLLDENRSETPRLKFLIQAPVSEKEAQKQLERDKHRAEEKLDELEQRSGNADQSSTDSDSGMPDREPAADQDASADSNDQQAKKDEPKPEENSPEKQNPNGEESKDGGKGGGDSDSSSNGDDGKEKGDETGKSNGDKTDSGDKGSGAERREAEPKPEGKKGESGSQKPVSNDGSQDDEILKELIKQNRESKPDPSQNAGKKGSEKKGDGDSGQSPKDRPDGEKSGSPDAAPGEKDDASESPSPRGNDTKDGNSGEQPKDGSSSEKPNGNSTEEDGMPGDKGNKPPKDNVNPESSSNSNKAGEGGESSKAGMPQDDQSSDMPGGSSGMPDSESSKTGEGSSGGDEPKSSPNSEPSGDPSKADGASEAGKKNENGSGNESSESGETSKGEPGDASKGGQPGKSDGSNSKGQDGSSGEGASSDSSGKGSDGKSSAENGSKSGAGGDSKDQPPGSGSSKPAVNDDGKRGDGATDQAPSESSTDKPPTGQRTGSKGQDDGNSGKASDDEAGSETSKEISKSGGDKKPGDAKSGKPAGGDASGKAGKPGGGNSDGGEPGEGSPGAGQSQKPGGKPGQSTGSKPNGSSDPGGDSVASPDDDANLNDAVQRSNSGANPTDPSLTEADEANLDDKLKASNMVLKRLKEELERGDVDPELLKKLGWTEKDMQRFAERLERQLAQPKPGDPAAETRRRQFEEVLRNVDLESTGRAQSGDVVDQKSTNNFSERRLPAPRSHRKAYEDYIKRLSQQRRGAGVVPSGR